MGIALWLVPNAEAAAKIKMLMQLEPSVPPQSPSSFPSVYPHVTLALESSSDPSALRNAALGALETGPVSVRFKSLHVGDRYFMSIFIAVHSPAGSALEDLRAQLRAALVDGAVPELPHMSLYYIDDADRAERQLIARRLESERRVLQRQYESGDSGSESVATLVCFGTPDLWSDAQTCGMSGEGIVESSIESDPDPEPLEGFEGEEIWLVRCEGPVIGWEVLERFSHMEGRSERTIASAL